MKLEETFDRIAQEHGAMIKRIALSYEFEPSLAEDLVQDIYLAIWRALPAFRGAASLRTFVARIATNRSITHIARSRRWPPNLELGEDIPAPDCDPESQAIASNRHAALMHAVRNLPLAYRQPVMLTLEGLAPGEAAQALGISANAVAIRLSRAKGMLRTLIGDQS